MGIKCLLATMNVGVKDADFCIDPRLLPPSGKRFFTLTNWVGVDQIERQPCTKDLEQRLPG